MSNLRTLYQEVIFDHGKAPRNHRELPGATLVSKGHNPLCGDKLTVYATLQEGLIHEVTFQGVGCAISQASASLMTQALKGKTLAEADALFEAFHAMVTGQREPTAADEELLGKLTVFRGVNEFPARVKCATLGWHTIKNGYDLATSADAEKATAALAQPISTDEREATNGAVRVVAPALLPSDAAPSPGGSSTTTTPATLQNPTPQAGS